MSDDDRWDDDAMRWTPDDERQSGRGLTVGTVIFDEVDNWASCRYVDDDQDALMTDMTQPTTVDVERVILIPRTAYHRLVEFAPDPRYDDSWDNSGDAARWPTPLGYHDLLCHDRECVDIACRS